MSLSVAIISAAALFILSAILTWLIYTINSRLASHDANLTAEETNEMLQPKSRHASQSKPLQAGTVQIITTSPAATPAHTRYANPIVHHIDTYGQSPLNQYKTAATDMIPAVLADYNPPLPSPRRTASPTYNQQMSARDAKAFKKIGSSESTGSSYYQQVMKNKGGVKSISQYGELLKTKKARKPTHGK